MGIIFHRTPREFGIKRLIIHTHQEFLDYVNVNNGKSNIFTSTYDFKTTKFNGTREVLDRDSLVIPHLLFDLDSNDRFIDMLRLHTFCKVNNYLHRIIYSGKGFHVYILVNENPINTITDVLLFQNKVIKQLGIKVDPTCIGNKSHMIRVPGTFNVRRGKWCISLKQSELTTPKEIEELAEVQRNGIYNIPGELLKLPHQKSSDVIPDIPSYALPSVTLSKDIDILIPCLQTNIRCGGYIPHMERVWITQYLSEVIRAGKSINDLTETEINDITEEIVDFFRDILIDFNERKTRDYVKTIVRKYEFSPSCESLQNNGMCITSQKCWRRDYTNILYNLKSMEKI